MLSLFPDPSVETSMKYFCNISLPFETSHNHTYAQGTLRMNLFMFRKEVFVYVCVKEQRKRNHLILSAN